MPQEEREEMEDWSAATPRAVTCTACMKLSKGIVRVDLTKKDWREPV